MCLRDMVDAAMMLVVKMLVATSRLVEVCVQNDSRRETSINMTIKYITQKEAQQVLASRDPADGRLTTT